MAEPQGGVSDDAISEKIAAEILKVHKESYGTGGEITVHLLEDLVVVLIDGDPSTSEQTLIGAGHGDAVIQTREAFQEAIGPTFKAIVERATGRTVETFLSRMSIDPLFALELFRLRPSR